MHLHPAINTDWFSFQNRPENFSNFNCAWCIPRARLVFIIKFLVTSFDRVDRQACGVTSHGQNNFKLDIFMSSNHAHGIWFWWWCYIKTFITWMVVKWGILFRYCLDGEKLSAFDNKVTFITMWDNIIFIKLNLTV